MSDKHGESPARAVIGSRGRESYEKMEKHPEERRPMSALERSGPEQTGGDELKNSSWSDTMQRGICHRRCPIENSDDETA